MTLKQKLFSFNGRLRRRDYWLLTIGVSLVWGALYLIVGALIGADFANKDDPSNDLAQVISAVPILWPSLAVPFKRLHDRDQSAWWYLLIFIPVIGVFWAIINMGILEGTAGRNRFGSSPKFPETADEVFA